MPLSGRTLASGNRELTITPSQVLSPNTTYTLRAEGLRDTSGNVQPTSVERSFTTGAGAELDDLRVWNVLPYNNQGHIGVNTEIRVRYSQRLNLLSKHGGRIGLRDVTDGADNNVPATVSIEGEGGNIVVLRPAALLSPGGRYRVSDVSAPYVTGQNGDTVSHSSYFTTRSDGTGEDHTAPVVVDWNVPEGYSGFPQNGQIVVAFNEALDFIGCPVRSSVGVRDSVGNEIAYGWELRPGDSQLLITPVGLLADTTYTVTIDGLCDVSGNAVGTLTRTVMTGSGVDETRPGVVGFSPSNGETGVSVTSSVTLGFNEPVYFRTSNGQHLHDRFYVYVGSSSNRLSGDYSWNADHSAVTFTPDQAYPADTQVTAYGSSLSSYFYDLGGNSVNISVRSARFTTN